MVPLWSMPGSVNSARLNLYEGSTENHTRTDIIDFNNNSMNHDFIGGLHLRYTNVFSVNHQIKMTSRLSGSVDAQDHLAMIISKNKLCLFPIRSLVDIFPVMFLRHSSRLVNGRCHCQSMECKIVVLEIFRTEIGILHSLTSFFRAWPLLGFKSSENWKVAIQVFASATN